MWSFSSYRKCFAFASIFDGCVKDAQTGESLNLADRMEKLDIDVEQAYKQAHAKGLEIGDWLDTPIKTKSRGYGGFSMSD